MRINTQELSNGNRVVTVEYGANDLPVTVEEGDTVFSIRKKYSGELNIPNDAPAKIGDRMLSSDEEKAYVPEEGDTVTFLKKSGTKN